MTKQTRTALLAAAAVLGWSITAFAQLDPLTLIKRVPPTVIIVVDTSLEMLQDGNGKFYDPGFYSRTADPSVSTALSVPAAAVTYRRIFEGFTYNAPANTRPRRSRLWRPRGIRRTRRRRTRRTTPPCISRPRGIRLRKTASRRPSGRTTAPPRGGVSSDCGRRVRRGADARRQRPQSGQQRL